MNSSTSEFSTSPNIAVVAAAAAPTSSTPAAHKRPFATLMPNSSPCVVSPTEKMGYAKNEPHRAFPPTYRNPTLMPSSPLNVAAKEKRGSANELHRPFPSTHRNPSFMPSSSLDIAVVKKREVIDGPHRAFPPTHRNPSALPASLVEIAAEEKQGFMDEAHRAFPPTYRNPSVMPSPSLLDIAAEEKQGSANEPHRPFPSTHRNAEGEEVPLSQMSSLYESKSFSPSQTALDLGVVEGEAHRPFSPTYRNPSDVGDVAAAVDEGKDKEEVGGEQQPHRAFEAGYRNPDPRVGIEKVQVHRSFTVLHGKSKGGREQQGRLEVGESVAQLKEEVSVGGVEERRSEMGRGDGHRPFEVHFRNPPLDEDLSSTGVVAAAASLVQQGQEKDESQGYVGDVLPSMASVGRVQDQPETGIAAYPSLSVDLREREPLDAAASLSTTGFVPGVSSSQVKPAEDAESDLQGSSSATSGLLISQSTSGVQHSEPFKSPEPEQQDSEQGNQPAQSPIALHPHTLKTPSSAAPPIQQAHTPSSAAAATLPNIKIISNNPSIVSPAGSEKSFATAEGGSSSSVVHVRLSDAGQEAENGKPLELQREERDVEPAREEIVTPLRRSGSVRRGFAVGSKRNKAGMFKGLRNSLRRGRE
ncbi:uncharacterized protein RCC_08038 [Ramularia collo-cygni]|uniref:Uncharacterized protein n=1 Tax=Ramularia collo-cygni TaxID=112498 RepID=A0A2D3VJB7_9PEZI|nr:uncharacterized protein RCC_08038 [Ramularia collo-cygni]CZT22169.1 uncharacterized protein RCC_08038 [Ramularia collo-cygni]